MLRYAPFTFSHLRKSRRSAQSQQGCPPALWSSGGDIQDSGGYVARADRMGAIARRALRGRYRGVAFHEPVRRESPSTDPAQSEAREDAKGAPDTFLLSRR